MISQESPCRQEAVGKKKAVIGQGKGKAWLLATEWELIPSTKCTIHHGWVVERVNLRRTRHHCTDEKYPKTVWHLILDSAAVLPKLSLLYA